MMRIAGCCEWPGPSPIRCTTTIDFRRENRAIKLFFYGLFMDRTLLAEKGVEARDVSIGFTDGYALRIGERATLSRQADARAWGAVMEVTPGDAETLYSEDSVADYVPEVVTVELADGGKADATCYNLPAAALGGTNFSYAEALLEVAKNLGLPEPYLDEIRRAGKRP